MAYSICCSIHFSKNVNNGINFFTHLKNNIFNLFQKIVFNLLFNNVLNIYGKVYFLKNDTVTFIK